MTTANIGLSLLAENQQGAEVTYNESILHLDALVHASAINEQSAPPIPPYDGDVYLVSNISGGAWANYAGHLAYYVVNQWKYVPPKEGMRVWIQSSNKYRYYDGIIYSDLYLREDALSMHIEPVAAQDYAVILTAFEAITITKLTGVTLSGTCDVGLSVNDGATTPVLSVTSTVGNITDFDSGTGGDQTLAVAAGNKLEFVVSNLASPVDLQLMITFDKVSL